MAQGVIEYQSRLMLNCRESFLENIGAALAAAANARPECRLRGLVEEWNRELREMPPGCANIRLDTHLRSDDAVTELIGLLMEAK